MWLHRPVWVSSRRGHFFPWCALSCRTERLSGMREREEVALQTPTAELRSLGKPSLLWTVRRHKGTEWLSTCVLHSVEYPGLRIVTSNITSFKVIHKNMTHACIQYILYVIFKSKLCTITWNWTSCPSFYIQYGTKSSRKVRYNSMMAWWF